MTIQPDAILGHVFGIVRHRYESRDAILYALGIGLGQDPLDRDDLPYLYERDLQVFPTYAVTLGSPGMWIRNEQFGVDFKRLVHSEHDAIFYKPLAAAGEVTATAKALSLTDRGEGKGAVLTLERQISGADDELLCRMRQTLLLRGNGGFGGVPPERPPSPIPNRDPDLNIEQSISTRAALLYRLSGDWNPLHVDPEFANGAGFDRPILHGLASYGTVCAALCRAIGIEPNSVARIGCRFAGVVYPGDTLSVSIWKTETGFAFRASANGRAALDYGVFEVRK